MMGMRVHPASECDASSGVFAGDGERKRLGDGDGTQAGGKPRSGPAYAAIRPIRRTATMRCVCRCSPLRGWCADAARLASLIMGWNVRRTRRRRQQHRIVSGYATGIRGRVRLIRWRPVARAYAVPSRGTTRRTVVLRPCSVSSSRRPPIARRSSSRRIAPAHSRPSGPWL
jgi:hypothetical protein